jgi:DNA-binding NarL/FixJ family response regulator
MNAAPMPITTLVAEDHETVRLGLRALLESQSDIVVVDEVTDGRMAVERSQTLQPAIVVMDVSMPEMNGLAATRAIKDTTSNVNVIAFTRHDDSAFMSELMEAGASGYVLKQSSGDELLKAIRVVARGGRYVDNSLVEGKAVRPEGPERTPRRASERERMVLRRMAVGYSNKEIAFDLGISVKTVEAHKANAMRKLGLRGRIDVVRYAVLQGWLSDR